MAKAGPDEHVLYALRLKRVTSFDANIQRAKSELVFMARTIRALTKGPVKLFLPIFKIFSAFW